MKVSGDLKDHKGGLYEKEIYYFIVPFINFFI